MINGTDALHKSVIEQGISDYLDNRNVNPSQVFDFNPDALDKILGSVLYQNHPAEGGNYEEGKPKKDAKTNHFRTINQCQCQCQQLPVGAEDSRSQPGRRRVPQKAGAFLGAT